MESNNTVQSAESLPRSITVDTADALQLSPLLFGFNIEHTRACVNGGLSAQILRNRKFAGKPSKNEGVAAEWFSVGGEHAYYYHGDNYQGNRGGYVRHYRKNDMFRQNEEQVMVIQNVDGSTVGIGQSDLCVKEGKDYDFRIVLKSSVPVTVRVALTDSTGSVCYAENRFDFSSTEWETVAFPLTPGGDDAKAVLSITFNKRATVTLGAVSLLPADTFHGMRRDVLDALKALSPALLRWPGGNFAGEYRWLDGLLPVDMRAPLQAATEIETQPYTHGYDFHEINTDDFVALCRYVGAEPSITVNPVWDSPEESAAWVEYCNGDETTEYGALRVSRGFTEPYNVKYWALGNEMGYKHMEGPKTPQQYAELARKHLDAMLKVTPDLHFCSSGSQPSEKWANGSAKVLADKVKFVSAHHYAPFYIDFTDDEKLVETVKNHLAQPATFRERIRRTRQYLGEGLHIAFDEWNLWYAWYRPSCSVDGLFAAEMIHMLSQESIPMDVPVACYFQPIGEGAIEITPDTCRLTAIGRAIEFLACHKGAKLCRISTGDDFRALATLKDGALTVTLVNPDQRRCAPVTLRTGKKAVSASALVADKILPHTYLTESGLSFTESDDAVICELPPCSIGKIVFR